MKKFRTFLGRISAELHALKWIILVVKPKKSPSAEGLPSDFLASDGPAAGGFGSRLPFRLHD